MTVLAPKEQAEMLKNSPAEEQIATLAESINVWLSNRDGRFALNFSFRGSVGRWDYVALCDGDPGNNGYGYLDGQWQYISATNSPFITGTNFDGSGRYWVMYASWDYGAKVYRVDKKSNVIG
ncbi:hypothetical protein [Phormidesmis priestleyi]